MSSKVSNELSSVVERSSRLGALPSDVSAQATRRTLASVSTLAVLAGLAGLVLVASACSPSSSGTTPSTTVAPRTDAKVVDTTIAQAAMEFTGEGSGRFVIAESPSSAYATNVATSNGELLRLRAPGTNRDILVAASLGAVAKPLNGWKVSTVSNDAMFDPDRCSTLHPVSVEGTSDLAVFETGIRPDGEGSADANSNWYQLTVTDGKTFRKLTPTPSFNEVAYPATLSSLGNGRVGYLWTPSAAAERPGAPNLPTDTSRNVARNAGGNDSGDGSGRADRATAVSGSGATVLTGRQTSEVSSSLPANDRPAVIAKAGGTSVGPDLAPGLAPGGAPVGAMPTISQNGLIAHSGLSSRSAGQVSLMWREVDLRSFRFVDRPVIIPGSESFRSAYRRAEQIVLETQSGSMLALDLSENENENENENGGADGNGKSINAIKTIPVAGTNASADVPTPNEQQILSSVAKLYDSRVMARSGDVSVLQLNHVVGEQMVSDPAVLNNKKKTLDFAPLLPTARRCLLQG